MQKHKQQIVMEITKIIYIDKMNWEYEGQKDKEAHNVTILFKEELKQMEATTNINNHN